MAALLTVLVFVSGPAANAADPLTRSQQWRAIAEEALAGYKTAPQPTSFLPLMQSTAILAIARLNGWDDPQIDVLLSKLLAERNPDGGWGVGAPFPSKNGTDTNPATTTYTVTLAGHVGPTLLAAYKAGVLTNTEPLKTITSLLMTTGRINTPEGQCVAYSRSSFDVGTGLCVHNVNAGVADYLTQAAAAGFGKTGLQKLVVDITRRENSAYNPAWSGWSYQDNRTVSQDPDHQGYEGRSFYFLMYPVGREAIYHVLAAPTVNDDSRRGHMQLVATPGGPGSQGLVDKTTTLWCEMGDRWLDEAADYVAASTGDAMRLAQAADLAAANSLAC
jgi:hypothetical protein